MLTGSKPFQSRDTDKLLQMISFKAPPKPHQIAPAVPVALSRIVLKAMSKQADKRYQTAGDMASELKHYLVDDRRIRRHRRLSSHASARTDAQSRRHRYAMTAVGILLIGTLLIGFLVDWHL